MKNIRAACAAAWERLIAVRARNAEDERLGRLFNILMVISLGICITMSCSYLALYPLGLTSAEVSWIAAGFPLFFIPIAVYCMANAKRGRIRPMVQFYVGINFAGISIAIWLFDGLLSPGWLLYAWNITIAGILLAPAYALWLTCVAAGYFMLLAGLTVQGVYRPLLSFGAGREFANIAVVWIILVSTVGLLTWLNMRSLREALEKLHGEIAARQQTEEHLRQSEERYRNVFNNAEDIIFTMGADGALISLNPAFEKIFGQPVQEWVGRPFEPLVSPEDLPRAWEVLRKTLQGDTVGTFELSLQKLSGEYFIGEFTVAPLKQEDSVILLGICRDITERKRMEGEIRQLNEALEAKVKDRTRQLLEAQEELVRKEKLSVLGQVAGSVGHELRNPLGVMSNAVYFLQAVLSDADDTVKEYLGIINTEIARSERIVSDLLDSVRTKPPRPDVVGLKDLIEQTLRKCAVPDSVSVRLDFPATLPPLRVDAPQIHQVLRNLVSNGVEAMPDGGTLTLNAVENQADGTVSVSVCDTGAGIAPEVLSKLFQPLFTTKARGIGLGLVVVKNLTEANGGKVAVQSAPGAGATFTVTLPADTANQAKGEP